MCCPDFLCIVASVRLQMDVLHGEPVESILGHLLDVEPVVHDLAFGQWNHLLGSQVKSRARVHGDRLY